MPRRPEFLVLAFDFGSSSARSGLFDEQGRAIAGCNAQTEYSIRYSADGGAELSPAILLRAARFCFRATMQQRKETPGLRNVPVLAVSGSSFWHGLLGLNRRGGPSTPIYTWADTRSACDAAQLREEVAERSVHARTGCMLRAPYWPAKLRWLRRRNDAAFQQTASWVSPATWLFAQLFGIRGTSPSMASGTGLFDLSSRSWDDAHCRLCGVSVKKLGDLQETAPSPSSHLVDLPQATVFPALGDGAASNLGSGAESPGRVALNVGTSAAVRLIETRGAGRLPKLPWGLFRHVVDADRTLLGGAISNAGNLRTWCLRELTLGNNPEKALSRSAAAHDTLLALPHLVKERAPTWPEEISGTFAGLRQTTSAAEIFRCATTASYYRLAAILEQIEAAAGSAGRVIVSGGIIKSPASLALLADSLGREIEICREPECSLRGAAVHALQHLGHEVAPLRPGRTIVPRPDLIAAHLARRSQHEALERRLIAR